MTNPTQDSIQAAIEQAKAAAAAAAAAALRNTAAAPADGVPAPAAPAVAATGTAVGMPVWGTPVSMDDLLVGSISVDEWLKVSTFGLMIGTNKTLFQDMLVEIDMTEVQPCYCIKFGNPAVYLKTYDRVSCASGGTWDAALKRAQQADPTAREYRSADIPMVLRQELKDQKGAIVGNVGLRLGHSLSTTNWREWESVYREIQKAGLQRSKVLVKLGYNVRRNSKGNEWGVITFTLIGPADDKASA